ncbi:glutathione S-transferase family protein [Colwellia demingiae]|nr:glutathione S-transferase family protein [Colwellia demingiae]
MNSHYTLYGWQLSYFAGKIRGYLNFKGIPYTDNNVNAFNLLYRIPKKIGVMVMPVVRDAKGDWLQDSSIIIDVLEQRFPKDSVIPHSPKQRVASKLLEAWADEWWIPIGLHYRWSYPENYPLFINDASKALLPYVPNFIRRPMAKKIAKKMHDFLPSSGVRSNQIEMIERWTNKVLDMLEQHFSCYKFLFGDKPSIADFALLGPLYGHLNRDPVPKRTLLDTRPNLQQWVERTHSGEGKMGDYLANDEIPDSVMEILNVIGSEFIPMSKSIVTELRAFITTHHLKSGDKLPRSVGQARCFMDGEPFSRAAMPYTVWMLQRIQKEFTSLDNQTKKQVDEFTCTFMNEPFSELDLGPALTRRNVATQLS